MDGFALWLFEQISIWQSGFWLAMGPGRVEFVVAGAVVSWWRLGAVERAFLGVSVDDKDKDEHERPTMDMRLIQMEPVDIGGPCPSCGSVHFVAIRRHTVHAVTGELLSLGFECVCGQVTDWPPRRVDGDSEADREPA